MERLAISRWIIAIIVIMFCSGSRADENLAHWNEFKRAEQIYVDYANFQRISLMECITASSFQAEMYRKEYVKNVLAHIRGDIPQRVRLLLWLIESNPEIRQEYILQWLAEKSTQPQQKWAEQMVRQMLLGRRSDAVDKRIAELNAVFEVLPKRHEEVQRNKAAFKYRVDKVDLSDSMPSAYTILDNLSEEALLNPDENARTRIYKDVLPPSRKRNGPDDIVGERQLQILHALFYRENDTATLQHLHTERVGVTNTYEEAARILDSEQRRESGEKVEDHYANFPPSPVELEYDGDERKRRREIGILEGVTIPRVHTENCCDLCDTREMTKRQRNKKEAYIPQIDEPIELAQASESVPAGPDPIDRMPERLPQRISKAVPDEKADKIGTAMAASPLPADTQVAVVANGIPATAPTELAEELAATEISDVSNMRYVYGLVALGMAIAVLFVVGKLRGKRRS